MTGMFFSEVCFKHSFLVNVELNQSTLYATNFGSLFIMDSIQWAFFLGLLVRWLSGMLFLMFDNVMTFLMQQTMAMEMTRLAKIPSTIKKTQLMWWKTMETIQKSMKRCLWTDSGFFWTL
jgi:hypothetical protein